MKTQILRNALLSVMALSAATFAATAYAAQQSATTAPRSHKATPTKAAVYQEVQQKLFPTPEAARDALVTAATAQDQDALAAIFGPDHEKLKSGDPVQDKRHSERFALHVQEACTLDKVSDTKYTLIIGARKFPFSIPIVKEGEQWRFDTAAGLQEILRRRIGSNELSAIMTARAIAIAQWEYFSQGGLHNEDGLAEYAQKFISTPGTHDGLYWETASDEDPSPLGPLVAAARAEGYSAGRSGQAAAVKPASTGSGSAAEEQDPAHPRSPYHGYYFKILKAQGPSAPGGKFSYLLNGHMIAGFALVAFPAEWGNSGVMTFIVNTQGRVYEKNLGPKTAELAPAMREYNPDPTWMLVPKN
ncbi:MAG TPA: DUF2950 domain-containing protein [Candidatus Solibacter sp.]|nr:DUF2950 domain-containing protein [Candidatus Solibacter sp.]